MKLIFVRRITKNINGIQQVTIQITKLMQLFT